MRTRARSRTFALVSAILALFGSLLIPAAGGQERATAQSRATPRELRLVTQQYLLPAFTPDTQTIPGTNFFQIAARKTSQ